MSPHFIILPSDNRQQLSHPSYLTTTTQSLFLFRSNNTLFLPMINKYNKTVQHYPNEQTCNNIVADAVRAMAGTTKTRNRWGLWDDIAKKNPRTNLHLGWRAAAESG
eukprot:scaffold36323_cov43-Cyclotella_meneghiniana.AAC.1